MKILKKRKIFREIIQKTIENLSMIDLQLASTTSDDLKLDPGLTLILPSVSIGNVGQLAVDVSFLKFNLIPNSSDVFTNFAFRIYQFF